MQTTESRRPSTDPPEHLPRWMQALLGASMCALGVALALDAGAALAMPGVLAGAGLVTAGLLRAAGSRHARLRHIELGVGIGVVALGLVALNWRDASPRSLAQVVAGALAAGGLAHLADTVAAPPGERLVVALTAFATLFFSALLLAWQGPALLALGAIVGAWLVFAGLVHGCSAFLGRQRAPATAAAVPGGATQPRRPMRLPGTLASLAAGLVVLGASLFLQSLGAGEEPDAFYDPPASVPPRPGQLVRVEPLATGVPAGARAWRMLYTTTLADGSPALASGTVLVRVASPAGPQPVVAIAHDSVGIAPRCAPSLSKQPFGGGAGAALEKMVAAGWAGVITDYVGLGTRGPHPYLVGEAEARAVLDAVRAAHWIPKLHLDARTAVWGHSEGGHGALWTGMLAPRYAPELRIIGVAATAPASDLLAVAEGAKDSALGKIVLAYVAGAWPAIYPGLDRTRLLDPGDAAIVARLEELCVEGPDMQAVAVSAELFGPVLRAEAFGGRFGALLRANSPTGPIAAPLLIAQGGADRFVAPALQARFVASRCAAGQALEYRLYPGLDNLLLVAPGSPLIAELVGWTRARLAGEAAKSSC